MKKQLSFLLFFLTVVSLFASEEWERSFSPEIVATYLPSGKEKMLLVGAGERNPKMIAMIKALAQALKGTGKAAMLMDDSPLGDISAMDDASVVKKCSRFPVTLIIVARYFKPSAVVTLYRPTGEVLNAFSVERGELLSPYETNIVEGGVSQSVLDAVSAAVKKDEKEPETFYDRELLWFWEWKDGLSPGPDPDTDREPRIGKYKKALTWDVFFRKVGREDLAIEFDRREKAKKGLFIGGLSLAVVGAVFVVAGASVQTWKNDSRDYYRFNETTLAWEKQAEDPLGPYFWSGLAMTITGTASWITGVLLNKNPATGKEVADMARAYNRELKKRTEGSGAEEKTKEMSAEGIDLMIDPFALPSGGGINLRVSY